MKSSTLATKSIKKRLKDYHKYDAIQSEKVKWLVKSGIDIDIQNDDGDTPLHLAIENNAHKVIKALIDLKANVNIKNNKQSNASAHCNSILNSKNCRNVT